MKSEFMEKAMECRSGAEIKALAEKENVILTEEQHRMLESLDNRELTDDEMSGVSGGSVIDAQAWVEKIKEILKKIFGD